jgi:hypothetical protein
MRNATLFFRRILHELSGLGMSNRQEFEDITHESVVYERMGNIHMYLSLERAVV